MVTHPKSLPVDATVGDVLDVFDDDHVHMVLLVEGAILRGTRERHDLPAELWPDSAWRRYGMDRPALGLASLSGRTVSPTVPALAARQLLLACHSLRSAVGHERCALLGLLCLKRRRTASARTPASPPGPPIAMATPRRAEFAGDPREVRSSGKS